MSGYKGMDGEQFLDHILDEGGLAPFAEEQFAGLAAEDWDWPELARRIHGLSGKTWQPNPGQIQALYYVQSDRRAQQIELAA